MPPSRPPLLSTATCRIPAALLLLVGSILKMVASFRLVIAGGMSANQNLEVFLLVSFELLLAVWLISGIWPKYSRGLSIIVFSVFLLFLLRVTYRGEPSCGCFGDVSIPPLAAFTLDTVALMALFYWSPGQVDKLSRWICWGLIPCAVCITCFAWTHVPVSIESIGDSVNDGKTVFLRPVDWLHKPFPLVKFINNPPADILRNKWVVLLYQEDCQKCNDVIESFARNSLPVLLVEISGSIHKSSGGLEHYFECAMNERFNWLAVTPCVILLDQGIVVGVSADYQSE